MENKDKIILDLCGGTGSWSRPYQEAGYDVRLITLPEHDVLTCEPPEGVYGILAAPPCTEFSVAKGSSPRDFDGGMAVVAACLRIIWKCRMDGSLKFWALENPVGFLRQFLGVPAYQFEQWEFGLDKMKRTDIWGYFRIPSATVKIKPTNLMTSIGEKAHGLEWTKLEVPAGENYAYLLSLPYSERRAALRAITPPGFANAFFRANR